MTTTTGFEGTYINILFLFGNYCIMYNNWEKQTILQILYIKVMFLYCFKIITNNFFVKHRYIITCLMLT